VNNEGTDQKEDTSTCKNRIGGRENLSDRYENVTSDRNNIITTPTPPASVAENAYRTLIVGLSQVFNLSSPLRDWINWSTWF
jgi:hypothetical protein